MYISDFVSDFQQPLVRVVGWRGWLVGQWRRIIEETRQMVFCDRVVHDLCREDAWYLTNAARDAGRCCSWVMGRYLGRRESRQFRSVLAGTTVCEMI